MSLHMYTFDTFGYHKVEWGVFVGPWHTTPESDPLFKKMGFDSRENYINSYPGNYRFGSKSMILKNPKECSEHEQTEQPDLILRGGYSDIWDDFYDRMKKIFLKQKGEMFIAPTFADFQREAQLNRYYHAYRHLMWFCSDWGSRYESNV